MSAAPTPRVTLILARARNGVIGAGGGLPWRLPEDLQFFKRTTMGHPIVMGRKTWESIGRPLPGRRSVVVSRDRGFAAPGAEIVHSLDEAIERCAEAGEIFVIGGAQLYADALPRADRLLLTEIHADFDGDTFLPAPASEAWAESSRERHPPTDSRSYAFDFVDYRRRERGR
ncbi:MAG TPA: dihydrofolate reductase [Burkholderiaceae bacterium]|nr:dihydrofolate reductase [Burkholderiaceae bacterium]